LLLTLGQFDVVFVLYSDWIDNRLREDQDLKRENLAEERIVHLKGEQGLLREVLRVLLDYLRI